MFEERDPFTAPGLVRAARAAAPACCALLLAALPLAALPPAALPPAAPPAARATAEPGSYTASHGGPAVDISTSAAPLWNGGRLTLNFVRDHSKSRVDLEYSLRWDFSDLKRVELRPALLLAPFKALASWDYRRNTRVRMYGVSANPWEVFAPRRPADRAGRAKAASGTADAAEAKRARRRGLRLSLRPLAASLLYDLDRTGARIPKNKAMRGRQMASIPEKKFIKYVAALYLWELPGFHEGREFLEGD